MKLIIDIDEDVRVTITRMGLLRIPDEMQKVVDRAIQNGTPLPKGHGDIVDIETLIDMFWDGNSMEITNDDLSVIEPIIKADKAESEDV
ncbi:MAG: hypothetical protein J6S85_16960 [Methanobrevibacter sp.]|nr:hypothetical protein [Methanobrevibacter sp.]